MSASEGVLEEEAPDGQHAHQGAHDLADEETAEERCHVLPVHRISHGID